MSIQALPVVRPQSRAFRHFPWSVPNPASPIRPNPVPNPVPIRVPRQFANRAHEPCRSEALAEQVEEVLHGAAAQEDGFGKKTCQISGDRSSTKMPSIRETDSFGIMTKSPSSRPARASRKSPAASRPATVMSFPMK